MAIVSAIRGHRAQSDQSILGKLIYTADKKSRNCFSCKGRTGMLLVSSEKKYDDPILGGFSMKIGNREFDVKNKTYIMGILNVTPDSFSDGGKWNEMDHA